ncbi:glycoside hydrolase family 5 protein [Piromyces sp. E2]|nr:glycoside hydrolase family 5 protein [Piromyces sp. E2]|eukprot:OUM58167.1 glycoside hydrolase family 5 protein [Piromyces sp. E2]
MNSLLFNFIFGILLSYVFSLPANSGKGLHVIGNKLYDGNGEEFIMRGVNIHHNWSASYTEQTIRDAAALGANSARFVLGGFISWYTDTVEDVEKIVKVCEDTGVVCVFEIHDYTASDDPANIDTAIEYWTPFKDLFNAHKDYVILNIANEWMKSDDGVLWSETYIKAVKRLREIGFECLLMIDCPGNGEGVSPMATYGPSVVAEDPFNNIIFSLHVLGGIGYDKDVIARHFEELQASGICWYISELLWRQNNIPLAYKFIMKYTALNLIGWHAWSWAGNSNNYADLVDASTFSKDNIKDYGKFIFYSKYGIQNTSKLANGRINDVLYNTNPDDAHVEPMDEVSMNFTSNFDITMEEYEDEVDVESENELDNIVDIDNEQEVNAEIDSELDSKIDN